MSPAIFNHNEDIRKILGVKRLPLGRWPTPLVDCTAFSNLMIKRDDLSGFGRGGIKTRKLETFFGYYLEKDIRTFIIAVPNLSNLRSDVERIAGDLGLTVHFVVANDPPLKKRQHTNTSRITYTLSGGAMPVVAYHIVRRYLQWRFIHRKRVAVVLPSASHPASVIGSSIGLLELWEQCKAANRPMPANIFISASGGASAAGLILAALLLRQEGMADLTVHAVKVFPIPMKYWLLFLLKWTRRKYKLKVPIDASLFKVWHSHTAYGATDATLEKNCEELKEKYGLQVDHIYGAQTWNAMKRFIDAGHNTESLLFWHCGYTPDAAIFKTDHLP